MSLRKTPPPKTLPDYRGLSYTQCLSAINDIFLRDKHEQACRYIKVVKLLKTQAIVHVSSGTWATIARQLQAELIEFLHQSLGLLEINTIKIKVVKPTVSLKTQPKLSDQKPKADFPGSMTIDNFADQVGDKILSSSLKRLANHIKEKSCSDAMIQKK